MTIGQLYIVYRLNLVSYALGGKNAITEQQGDVDIATRVAVDVVWGVLGAANGNNLGDVIYPLIFSTGSIIKIINFKDHRMENSQFSVAF